MADTFRKILDLLDAKERRSALLLFGMMLVMGLFEVIGVGSIMPFISVVANPEIVSTNPYLATLHDGLGFTNRDSFLVFLGGVVFILVIGSLTFTAVTHWTMVRYAYNRNYALSCRLLRGYLGQPYSFFLNRNSSDLGKTMLSEVEQVVEWNLMAVMKLTANAIVALCLILLIVAVDPFVALSAMAIVGGAYTFIYLILRRYVSRIGAKRVRANQDRFQVAQEALGGIKDVKVLGLEDIYMDSFRRPASRFATTQANNRIISEMPKFALQGLLFGGMLLLLVSLLLLEGGSLANVLPIIGLFAFAGARLIPALEQVYRALTALRFGKPALDALHKDLAISDQVGTRTKANEPHEQSEPIRLRSRIELDRVSYTYPGGTRPVLSDLSLVIDARTTVGIVGTTGAGKTTVLDIVLGLLEPQHGGLLVDGNRISAATARAWQRNIGYVSQSIFLIDDTVAANIALGVPREEIDQGAVERAARIAELHNFVIRDTPAGYRSVVGERGVRLSGGQRQRIGIARALYHDPDVLVLDEATSALDTLTERAVMDAVHNLSHRKTIIIVAHRLTTVCDCDCIFLLEQGRLVAEGAYDILSISNSHFGAMLAGIKD